MLGVILAMILLAASLVTVPVLAASPHFIGTPKIKKNSNFSLTAKFKAAGFVNLLAVNGSLTSRTHSGTAVLQCVDPGGDNPPPQEVNFVLPEILGTHIPIKNGKISASITLGPPSLPSASQICPDPDWTVTILSLTYEDVVLVISNIHQDFLTFNFGDVDP